jgi:hypothetical protein
LKKWRIEKVVGDDDGTIFFYVIFLVFLVETFKKVVFVKGITLIKVGN